MNYLPNKLLKLRKHYNYSQEYVAEYLNIDTLEYMSFENGNKIPSYDNMRDLSYLYHLELIDVFKNSEEVELYDISNTSTDDLNIKYFLDNQTPLEKAKDFVIEHKIATGIIAVLLISIIVIVSYFSGSEKPYVAKKENINRLSVSQTTVVYIDDLGYVNGSGDNSNGQINFGTNKALKVVEGDSFTIILNEDGTLTSVGWLSKYENELSSYSNIEDIAAGDNHLVILDNQNRAYCVGDNTYKQCDLPTNRNIKKIFATSTGTILVSNDGSISMCGNFIGSSSLIKSHSDIIDVASSEEILVVLNSNNRLNVYANSANNYLKAEGFSDIVDVACGEDFVAALDSLGKVHIEIENPTIEEQVNSWNGIIAIDAGENYLIGFDGNKIYGVGKNNYHQFSSDAIVKQTLPQVSNVEIINDEEGLLVQFESVKNASGYLVAINVGTGIEQRLSKTQTDCLINTENMIDGKKYTVSIITIGSGDYGDSQPYQKTFTYEKIEKQEEGNIDG